MSRIELKPTKTNRYFLYVTLYFAFKHQKKHTHDEESSQKNIANIQGSDLFEL